MGHGHDPHQEATGGRRHRATRLRLHRTLSRRRRPPKFYQKHHTHALAATLSKKLPAHIPEEIFPHVVAFWAHAGFYVSKAAVEGMRATRAEFTSQARVLCPQARRWLDEVGELADPALVQRASDALAALEVSVGLDPGAETNPIEADLSDSEGTSGSEG